MSPIEVTAKQRDLLFECVAKAFKDAPYGSELEGDLFDLMVLVEGEED